jgi:hypothetical protein
MEVPKVCEGSDAAAEVTAFPRWRLHPLWVRSWSGEQATDIAGYRSGGARLHYRLIGVIWRRLSVQVASPVSGNAVFHPDGESPLNCDTLGQTWKTTTVCRRPLILWIVFCSGCTLDAAESFTIRSTGAVVHSEVRYFLTGAFGGYGGFVRNPDKDGTFRIPLEREGRPASSFKAILYARGCQFTVLSADLLADPTRNATFECRQLSTIALRGRISPPPSGAGALDVEIRYLASWGHKFFGIADGIVQSFSVGKAPLNPGGRFQIQIPNFSKDPITNRMQDAYLEVLVVEHSSWNLVERVLPAADLQYQNTGLKILPGYDPEIVFGRWR